VPNERLTSARLVALAALALLLFGFPFVAVLDGATLVLGVPVLWAYLFAVWGLVIALVAWVVRR
jgi:hypothetical protein